MPSSAFYTYFVHVLRCSKQGIQTETKPKKVLKLSYFCKKRKSVFFSETPVRSQKFSHLTHAPPFENFSLDTFNSEQKPSVKNRSIGPVRNRSTGRSTDDDFEIYRSGRVKKILTGSISALYSLFQNKVSLLVLNYSKN